MTVIQRSKNWWKEGIVYQIYPRSFKDSNEDGIGDINGILEKLDYIKSLGVNIIWLCPVYGSPNKDNGYDISDYRAIMSEFGSMADFDLLLEGIHARGMRIIMDLVANHTSDQHEWFLESKSSIDSPKRDYYIWKDPINGGVPNNWTAFFSGSTWELDPQTGQYYLHSFVKEQPDLNWENPEVRTGVHGVMKYWLDKGIDGFRMDVISIISKRHFNDSPYESFSETVAKVYANGPRLHEFLHEMNVQVLSKYDIMTVGEGPGISLDNAAEFVGEDRAELNMIFHFDHMFIDHGENGRFDPVSFNKKQVKDIFIAWDRALAGKGWGSIFLGNHDFARMVSRFGNDGLYRDPSAKLLATLLMTMRGTPYVYQGDELGMVNNQVDRIEQFDDVEIQNTYQDWKNKGKDLDAFISISNEKGRDNARTPMQWDATPNGGFSTVKPWLASNQKYKNINVALQEKDPNSILNYYRKLIQYRKDHLTLVYGTFEVIQEDHDTLFAYWRKGDENLLIIHNLSDDETIFCLDNFVELKIEISNYQDSPEGHIEQLTLRPWESMIYRTS